MDSVTPSLKPDNAAPVGRLHLLTVLRFPAAFWVLLFHLQTRAPLPATGLPNNFLSNGALAMSFFFVLSGAMLAYGYRDLTLRGTPVLNFYRARFARIVPAYAAVHVLALIWFTPASSGSVGKWAYVNLLSVFGVQAWFPHTMGFGANAGTWSISVEFFFYALFPVALVALRAAPGPLGRWVVAAWLATSVFGLAGYFFGGSLIYYVLPALRLPEFILGVLIGLSLTTPARRPYPLVLAGASALAALAATVNPVHQFTLWTAANVVVVPAFGALIHASARLEQQRGLNARAPAWRLLIYLGEASYCLFLFHLLPILFLDSAFGQGWKNAAIRTHGLGWLWGVTIVASLLGAVLLHELVEKPARRALFRHWRSRAPAEPVPAPVQA